MSTTRVIFAAALLATTAIGGQAEAAWLKSGSGTAGAAALRLSTPDKPIVDSAKCNNGGGSPTATLRWNYPAPLPPGFELLTATAPGGTASVAGTATTTSATIPLPGNNKVYVSVRAVAGTWQGARSPEVAAC
ncbi:hypothetical protein [Amycolatopsis sp. cg9]|uniref:hypothetical protein n=1 Tax=Amycolatopsis sp. cg9 TaxID=3238801 RepID=UPI003523F469